MTHDAERAGGAAPHVEALVAGLPEPALVVDAQGVVLAINLALLDLSGGEAGRLVGAAIEDLELADLEAALGGTLSLGIPGAGLLPGFHPLPLRGGLWLLLGRDLPAVARAARQWRRLVEATPTALLEVREDGLIEWMNSAACALLGYARDALVGEPVERLVPRERRELHRAHRAGYALRPVARPMGETRVLEALHASGARIPVEVYLGYARRNEEGKPLSSTVVALLPMQTEALPGEDLVARLNGLNRDLLRQRAQLEAKERQLRAVQDHLPAGLAQLDPAGKIRTANPRFAELVELAPAALPGRSLLELFSPTDQRRLRPLLRAAHEGHAAQHELVLGEGRRICELHLVPMGAADSLGRRELVTLWHDITDRHRAEQSLRESRARFQLALDAGEMGVFARDLDADTLTLDLRARRILGLEAAELSAHEPLGDVHPRDASAVEDAREHFLESGEQRRAWSHRVSLDEQLTWRTVEFRELRLATAPTRRRTVGVCWDVSEQRAHDAWRRDLQSIVESSFDLIAIAGLDGHINYRNLAFQAYLGAGLENLAELLGPDERGRAVLRSVLAEGAWYGEHEVVGRTGAARPVSQLVMLHHDESERPTHLSLVMRDLGEIREREEALRRSNAELEQFAYVASHDLKEPLRMVEQFSRRLEESLGPRLSQDEAVELGFVREGAERMQALVQGLLDFGRIDRGAPTEEVALDDVLDAALANLHVRVLETGAVIERDPLPRVRGVHLSLLQLFQNLVGNALKFCEETPRVEIRALPSEGSMVAIAVRDNGIGIAPDHHERIFQIFQRLHPRDRYEGSGVGLAIAQKVVREHGGTIHIDSTPSRGTTFTVDLPRA